MSILQRYHCDELRALTRRRPNGERCAEGVETIPDADEAQS